MSDNKDNSNKEKLRDQSAENVASKVENKQQQDSSDQVQTDPAEKVLQQDDSKVQNPNRNLAKGGNNRPYDK